MISLEEFLHLLYRWQWLPVLTALSTIYFLYYFFHVVHKPRLIVKEGRFRKFLLQSCPMLSEYYWPTFWCFAAHAQTLIRALIRSRPSVPFRRETLQTPDGGIVCLDWFDNKSSTVYKDPATRPTVLILPGLTGGSETSYCRHLVLLSEELGIRTIVANHRGFGASQLKTPRTFNAANTEDLKFVLSHINKSYPGSPIFGMGISMGGLIFMNYLNEFGDTDSSGLVGVMAVSVAWNCMESCQSLEQPINSFLFNKHLTRNLVGMLHRNLEVFERHLGTLPFDIHHVLKSRTIREFDERFTSPAFGFRDYEEYYNAVTLHTKPLHDIKVPVLCLNAADDPFSPLHAIPIESVAQNPLVSMVLTSYGGHIGFLEGVRINNSNYMERLFVEFARAIFDLVGKGKLQEMVQEAQS
ncbi:phospholipase ABHD3-like [Acropora muricata]|uniref:phospholipase ABHD3-like n=1 Tax=Acropora muricata TaxID=159855 RepID=UPI0010FCCE62